MTEYPIAGHWLASISFTARHDFSCIAERGLSRTQCLNRLESTLPRKVFETIKSRADETVSCPFITIADPRYPAELRETSCAPPVLFYRGKLALLEDPKVAIVGTRHCSQMAKNFTRRFAYTLSKAVCIVSGLAYGVDREAHLGSLSRTIGIAGQGLSIKFSAYQQTLLNEILSAGGLILSEFHPNQHAQKWTFVQRNRTIAGLSKALIVMEAPARSGALISAQNALDFNREVYAVPNHPFHKNAHGCLRLLQEGAGLALSPQQIIADLGLGWSDPILKALKQPCSINDLVQATGSSLPMILSKISELESDGLVECTGLFWQQKKRGYQTF